MFSGHQQHLTSAHIELLERILARAGIGDVLTRRAGKTGVDAARILIETFQNGVVDEYALYFALFDRREILPVETTSPVKDQKSIVRRLLQKMVFGLVGGLKAMALGRSITSSAASRLPMGVENGGPECQDYR